MKTILLTIILLCTLSVSYSQEIKENGTIYINHPYINAVNASVKAYLAKDDAANRKIYADTAKFWVSGMGMSKPMGLNDMLKTWDADFDKYDSISLKTVGYPDYLHYVDMDAKVVQSWWHWSGKSKTTGKWTDVDFVEFDVFNKDGKISYETSYGNFSSLMN